MNYVAMGRVLRTQCALTATSGTISSLQNASQNVFSNTDSVNKDV